MSNDRFKYRAWDGVSMRYDVTGFEQGVGNEMGGVFLDGDYFTMDEYCKHHHTFAEVMQYTGLTDKNGVEIFESDVVRILYTDWPSNTDPSIGLNEYKASISSLGSVVWNRAEYAIHFGCSGVGSIHPGTHGEIEVIGNIYENPELLKDADQ
jgi:uncharacterized phage protein (TIGR01671 family)